VGCMGETGLGEDAEGGRLGGGGGGGAGCATGWSGHGVRWSHVEGFGDLSVQLVYDPRWGIGRGMKEQIWGCMSKLGVTPPSSAIRCGYYVHKRGLPTIVPHCRRLQYLVWGTVLKKTAEIV